MQSDTGTSKTPSVMDLATKLVSQTNLLDEQMTEFLEGSRPTDSEKSPEPSTPLNAVSVKLETATINLDNISRKFQTLINKIV